MIKTKEDLRKFRKAKGLTQTQFGQLYGVSYITIMRLETGLTPIEKSYLIKRINMTIQDDSIIDNDCIRKALLAVGLSSDNIEAILMCYEFRKKIEKLLDNAT